ncbi:hypothetical protein KDJ21_023155 [Metabacillus litoralis]|uniref:hypothetical protein n=1 Tax=Metabacillus TaxID=2675233 RepID=UPI000EF5B3CD|nr:hypothetical protein [Metabacillus litoralis]MCM3160123.1 hypothetical protein [Metabacillus litoralis]MCM3408708.1 hypothetical protein [Metabacillus litoralis]UHA59630.1 hypothetical protein KDJ21_023155 [Metabacillus litoralis]
MKIKVIAKKADHLRTTVFYLNQDEPKAQQLYMAILKNEKIDILTIYNSETNQYEEVTSIFPLTFLSLLSQQILMQLNNVFPHGSYKEFIG